MQASANRLIGIGRFRGDHTGPTDALGGPLDTVSGAKTTIGGGAGGPASDEIYIPGAADDTGDDARFPRSMPFPPAPDYSSGGGAGRGS